MTSVPGWQDIRKQQSITFLPEMKAGSLVSGECYIVRPCSTPALRFRVVLTVITGRIYVGPAKV